MTLEKNHLNSLIDALELIAPDRDEYVNRRITHINFARIVVWLSVRCQDEISNRFVYASELRKFMKLALSRVHSILNEFSDNKILLKKVNVGGHGGILVCSGR